MPSARTPSSYPQTEADSRRRVREAARARALLLGCVCITVSPLVLSSHEYVKHRDLSCRRIWEKQFLVRPFQRMRASL